MPRPTSPGAGPDAQPGAISFLHRFGSALNPHFHFHVVVTDGLFSEDDAGTVAFHEATHLSADDVRRLQRTLQRRVLRLFQRRRLLDELTVADMLTWQASGGFSLDASVRIHCSDSTGRERLLRYCARPPFAEGRLRVERHASNLAAATAARPDRAAVRQVLYHPARPTPDGRTVLVLSPLEFLATISRLIPPARVHRHRSHGVLAPNARLRQRVVALGCQPDELPTESGTNSGDAGTPHAPAVPQMESPPPHRPDSPQRAAVRWGESGRVHHIAAVAIQHAQQEVPDVRHPQVHDVRVPTLIRPGRRRRLLAPPDSSVSSGRAGRHC